MVEVFVVVFFVYLVLVFGLMWCVFVLIIGLFRY